MLQLTNVCKQYASTRRAVDDVSVQLREGRLVALLGQRRFHQLYTV